MKKYLLLKFALIVIFLIFGVSGFHSTHAEPAPETPTAAVPPASTAGSGRKSIEFEESVVEGLGKRGKDSLSQVGENDNRTRPRLYKKRLHFKEEMKDLYNEMEYSR